MYIYMSKKITKYFHKQLLSFFLIVECICIYNTICLSSVIRQIDSTKRNKISLLILYFIMKYQKIFHKCFYCFFIYAQTDFLRQKNHYQLMVFSFLFLDFIGDHRDASTSMEAILFFTCTILLMFKNSCIMANQKKLAGNINAAINDWLSAKNDEESYKIMKEYAFKSKMFMSFILYSCFITSSIYVMALIIINVKQMFLGDTNVSGNIQYLCV